MNQLDDMAESLAQSTIKDTSTKPEMTTTNADGSFALTSTTDQGMDPTTSTAYPKNITIDVGGRKFKTSLQTLRDESGYFKTQLSNSWTWPREEDGSYFLDADPDLFAHLLTFMRRPGTFPLFYDSAKGFDYDLYNKLEAEAEYFQIDALHEWIEDKQYLKAIVREVFDTGNVTLDKFTEICTIKRIRKIYVCPRNISEHWNDQTRCGMLCRHTRGDNEVEYKDEVYVDEVSASKEIEFDASICRLA